MVCKMFEFGAVQKCANVVDGFDGGENEPSKVIFLYVFNSQILKYK